MAGQIKDWVYKKVDWAYSTGAWEWSVNVATTAELFKLFSSTVIFKDHANVYDNKHYGLVSKYDGLMIRPITGSNGYTGVMHFHLYNENDRYYSDLEGLYGEFTLRDLVLMVFKACGLMVSEAKRTYWVNQVLSLMITLPAERSWVCNTSIRRAGGYQVAAYVDKSIVDDIIDCMREVGMFESVVEILEEIESGTDYEIKPEQTVAELVEQEYNIITTDVLFNAYYESLSGSGQARWDCLFENISASYIYDRIAYYASNQHSYTINNKTMCNLVSKLYNPANDYPYYVVQVQLFEITDDNYHATFSHTSADMSGNTTTEVFFSGHRLQFETGVNNNCTNEIAFNISFFSNDGTTFNDSYAPNSNTFYLIHYLQMMRYISTITKSTGLQVHYSNYGYSEHMVADGVSVLEGADGPKSNTSSSNFWPSWAARAVTVHGYSGSNHPSYTYIPVGYGDYDYEEFTQARVQSGWIFNNTWLQRLGLTMELMDEYEPVEPDPDDPEPIQPDPDPTPEPTPPDPGILDISASRLFTVHQLSNAEVDNLGSFIYSQTFIDAIKNMFMEPMDAIIGCFILNYGSGGTLPLGANETLKLGSVLGATGVTGTKVTNQTFECSFGTKEIGEFYHNVLDYAPYTSIQIYLPYIGFVDLDTNEVMNSRITLKYRFDVFTGMCLARLFVNRNGVTHELYNFEGNSAVHIPLTGRDFTNAIAPMLSGAVGLIGGAATGNPVAMALGAKNMIGNTANVKRSGSLSSNTGVLGQQTPFILVNRPKAYNAASYNSYYGYPSNWTVTLSSCSGYTRCKDVHLDALSCSDQEREEIEALLREGVIF